MSEHRLPGETKMVCIGENVYVADQSNEMRLLEALCDALGFNIVESPPKIPSGDNVRVEGQFPCDYTLMKDAGTPWYRGKCALD